MLLETIMWLTTSIDLGSLLGCFRRFGQYFGLAWGYKPNRTDTATFVLVIEKISGF
jgi:hypothetical protein